jgi:exosome complex RNA-binding protein Rrp42 (RNase PH superfamily)
VEEEDAVRVDASVLSPLPLHGLVVVSTFGLYVRDDSVLFLADPNDAEELLLQGKLSICINQHNQVIQVIKTGNTGISQDMLSECMQLAQQRTLSMKL